MISFNSKDHEVNGILRYWQFKSNWNSFLSQVFINRSWETLEHHQTWTCVKLLQENTCTGVSFLIKLQAGALQLYLNKTRAQVLCYEFSLEHLFIEHLRKDVSVLFSQVLLLPMWRDARQWRLSNSVTLYMLISLRC